MLRLALPLIVSATSWTLMQFIDRMFLLWDSQEALAASLPSAMVWWMMLCFPLGICSYVNTFVSQYHGAGRPDRIGPAVWQGVWIGLFATPLVMATGLFANEFFVWIGHSHTVARLEAVYYQVLCWCIGSMLLSAALETFFTGRGETRIVMIVNIMAAFINIGLDYLWIFGRGGFPALGIEGAGWATVVAHWFKTAAYVVLFLSPHGRRVFGAGRFRLEPALLRRLLRFGGPSGLQLLLEIAGFTCFIMLMGRLGEFELAASTLAFNISSLAFMPMLGLGVAVSILVGQHLGENRDDLAARATWSSLLLALAYVTVISALYVLAPGVLMLGHLAGAANGAELRQTAIVLLRFVAAYNLFDALQIIFVNAIKGAGDTRFVLLVSIAMSLALIVVGYAVVDVLGYGLYACWWVITLWLWVVGGVYAARFLQGYWRHMRVIEPESPPDLDPPPAIMEAAVETP